MLQSFRVRMETARASSDTSNFLTAGNRWMETSPLSLLDVNSWTLLNKGALVVVLDMSLAVSSIFFNSRRRRSC